MSNYYLLASTVKREIIGDVIINLDDVESLTPKEQTVGDRIEPLYLLGVSMKSGDTWKAAFATRHELTSVIADITSKRSGRFTDVATDCIPQKDAA